mgnify:CR=1 FL=1
MTFYFIILIFTLNNFSYFLLIIRIICTDPKTPKIGYNRFTKFEKPNPENITALIHINIDIALKLFLLFATFFKNPIPKEIAVVKMEIRIIIPYTFFIPGHILFIAYTAGICSCFISTSMLIKNENTIVSNVISIKLTIIAMYFMFLVFDMSSFIEINTGISKTQL